MEETKEYLAEKCFITLCDMLKTKLFRTAKGILGNESLALEAVSEAVFKAFNPIYSGCFQT